MLKRVNEFNKEIEIKFKVDENILNKLKNIELSSYEEIDEYFFTENMLKEDSYLRFRKKKGKIILTLKKITLRGKDTKDCYEADEIDIELTEEQYQKMKNIFNAIFPIKWSVNKIRSKGFFNDCEICHDEVKGLGNFLEIEGSREKILEICKMFNIDMNKKEDWGYVKMGMKKAGLM